MSDGDRNDRGSTSNSGRPNNQAGTGPPAPPDLLAAPGYLVRRMYQAYTALWYQTVDSTLTGPQFAVLTAVQHHPGVDQGSLASVIALDRSTMADVARRLEDRGLIQRDTAPTDSRRKLLHLTEHGSQVLTETNQRARDLDRLLLKDYPEEGRPQLMADLSALAENWERLAER